VGLCVSALIVTGAAGCGDKDDGDLPSFSGAQGGSSPSATVSVTPAPTDPVAAIGAKLPKKGTELGDPKNPVKVGKTVSGDATSQAIQVAYLAFWVERARALTVGQVDETALGKVAVGDAATRVVTSVRELQQRKLHTEGGTTVNVVALKVAGSRATITDCFLDSSTNRKANGDAVETQDFAPTPLSVNLEQSGPSWRVSRLTVLRKNPCR
jgi:hypothetical protein